MKIPSFLAPPLVKVVLAGALALAVLTAGSAFADDASNAVTSPVKHSLGLTFDFGHENTGTNDFHGLPKEALDRLSPEQLMELAKSDQPPANLAIVVPIAMFTMIIACVWLGVSQRSRRARLLHDTLRLMIEKGQPIPPELLQSPDGGRRPRNDLRTGLVFTSVGIGLGALLLAEGDRDWPVALIPLLIGVAFLVARQIENNTKGQPK